MRSPFLHTEWRKLIMVNYEVSPEVLGPYLPAGTELDSWNGKYFVSVVGFKFLNTKVKGLSVPFHVNFEQVNLRFYVKRSINGEVRKGVVFIQEIIDKTLVKFVARILYKENYVQFPMRHVLESNLTEHHIQYDWKLNDKWNSIRLTTSKELSPTLPHSQEHFIAEHYWGYIQINVNKSYEFRVEHPTWEIYELLDYQISVDFEATYGAGFALLQQQEPSTVFLVEGSEVVLGDRTIIF